MEIGHYGTDTLWESDIMGLGHFVIGTQGDRYTTGLGHYGTGTLWGWDAMGLGH